MSSNPVHELARLFEAAEKKVAEARDPMAALNAALSPPHLGPQAPGAWWLNVGQGGQITIFDAVRAIDEHAHVLSKLHAARLVVDGWAASLK